MNTIISQLITLIYNVADTWFIGQTDNPCMVAASGHEDIELAAIGIVLKAERLPFLAVSAQKREAWLKVSTISRIEN